METYSIMNDDIPKIELREWIDECVQDGNMISSIIEDLIWMSSIHASEQYMRFYIAKPKEWTKEGLLSERMVINLRCNPTLMINDPHNCESMLEYIKRLSTL